MLRVEDGAADVPLCSSQSAPALLARWELLFSPLQVTAAILLDMRCALPGLGFRVAGAHTRPPCFSYIWVNSLGPDFGRKPDEAMLMVGNWLWMVRKARVRGQVHKPLIFKQEVMKVEVRHYEPLS